MPYNAYGEWVSRKTCERCGGERRKFGKYCSVCAKEVKAEKILNKDNINHEESNIFNKGEKKHKESKSFSLVSLLVIILFSVFLICLIFAINWKLTLAAFLFIIAVDLIVWFVMKMIRRH